MMILAAAALMATAMSPQSPGDWAATKARAEDHAARGQTEEARQAYSQALNNAASGRERVETLLAHAALIERSGPSSTEMLKEVETLYRTALGEPELMTPSLASLRVLAANNYGAFLLRRGRHLEAVDVLQPVEGEVQSLNLGRDGARYFYNLARAWNQSGKPVFAFDAYMRALELDPTLMAAGRDASRLALDSDDPGRGIEETGLLVKQLLAQRQLETVDTHMRAACSNQSWAVAPAYGSLLTLVVEYLTAAQLSPDEFAREWKQILDTLEFWLQPGGGGQRDRQMDEVNGTHLSLVTVGRRIESIRRLYAGNIPLVFDPQSLLSGPFDSWRFPKEDARIFSALTKAVGDWYFKRASQTQESNGGAIPTVDAPPPQTGDKSAAMLDRALRSYSLAWSIDDTNTDAALYLANLLLTHQPDSDPGGAHLNAFVDALFSAKGAAYGGNDWENVIRLHTLLGTIFEQQKRWGSEAEPKSAIFQWRHALDVSGRTATATESVARLHERLATAYLAAGRADPAWHQYVAAANGYAPTSPDAAHAQLEQARRINYQPTRAELAQLQTILMRAVAATPP